MDAFNKRYHCVALTVIFTLWKITGPHLPRNCTAHGSPSCHQKRATQASVPSPPDSSAACPPGCDDSEHTQNKEAQKCPIKLIVFTLDIVHVKTPHDHCTHVSPSDSH